MRHFPSVKIDRYQIVRMASRYHAVELLLRCKLSLIAKRQEASP
jgi:hypothetical protein